MSNSKPENYKAYKQEGIAYSHDKKEFDRIRYFGLGGTGESYPDRYKAARYGEYALTVDRNFIHYIKPQENSSHYKTRRLNVGKTDGSGICVTGAGMREFSFNASRFSAEQLTNVKHDFELIPEDRTILNIDWRINAISENSMLDNDVNQRLLDEKTFSFGFEIIPTDF